jgi:S-adenosylmethionine decarboxylase
MTPHEARGVHLLADLDQCGTRLDAQSLAQLLRDAARAGGASVISVHTHGFALGGGVAGVAVLAESHISVHTWPEFSFAAVDVFMCGDDARPHAALGVLVAGLAAGTVSERHIVRHAAHFADRDQSPPATAAKCSTAGGDSK